MPLCFAYGANMDAAAMAVRCPASRPLGLGRLARHRLAVMREGYLTVTTDPRQTVWGLVWDVPQADMRSLDRFEGVASGLYVKRHLPILTEAGSRRALVYWGTNAGPGLARPAYMEAVFAAAEAAGLPAASLAAIAAFLPPGGSRSPRSEALVMKPAVRPRFAAPISTVPSRKGLGEAP